MDISMRCPIWQDHYGQCRGFPEGTWEVFGDRTGGGSYSIESEARKHIAGMPDEVRAKLSTWIVNQRKLGIEPLVTKNIVWEAMENPFLRVSERIKRFYEFLSVYRYRPGEQIGQRFGEGTASQGYEDALCAWTESIDTKDLDALLNVLVQFDQLSGSQITDYKLTAKGVYELENVEKSPIISRQAFVAMWFSEEMMNVYSEAISPAVAECGFKSLNISNKDFNRKIDDEIIYEIRRSAFLVADFTCPVHQNRPEPRGGVYFEAGFAKGLNKEVIWTVKERCEQYLHFDTKTFNHIVWKNPDDLKARLIKRIGATIECV